MTWVMEQTEALLVRVVTADIKGVSRSCADILAHKQALWTFIKCDGVEPTNSRVYAACGIATPGGGCGIFSTCDA